MAAKRIDVFVRFVSAAARAKRRAGDNGSANGARQGARAVRRSALKKRAALPK